MEVLKGMVTAVSTKYSVRQLLDNPEPIARIVREKFSQIDWDKTPLFGTDLVPHLESLKREIETDHQVMNWEFDDNELAEAFEEKVWPMATAMFDESLRNSMAGGIYAATETLKHAITAIIGKVEATLIHDWLETRKANLEEEWQAFTMSHPGVSGLRVDVRIRSRRISNLLGDIFGGGIEAHMIHLGHDDHNHHEPS